MIHTKAWRLVLPLAVLLILGFSPQEVFAAEEGGWRPIYDVVMLWINFGILAFLLIKFLRVPIRDFFETRKDEVVAEIRQIESEKEKAEARVKEAQELLAAQEERLERIKSRILQEGKRAKEKIIEDAHEQTRVMMEEAKRRIDNRIYQAQQDLRGELIDAAVDIAANRLPGEVTEDDNQKYIQLYLEAAV